MSVQGLTGEDFQEVLVTLFALAGAVLRRGGALVTWLPFTQDWLGSAANGELTNILVFVPPCVHSTHHLSSGAGALALVVCFDCP